jgi:hypothetical protein
MDKVEWLFETETGESDEDFGSKCNLIWYDLPEAIPNKIITIYACSGGQKHLYLEVTAQDELAYFYNGLFYVFKKVKS